MAFTQKLTDVMLKHVKFKRFGRVEALLQFLINLTFTPDGQVNVIRLQGKLY